MILDCFLPKKYSVMGIDMLGNMHTIIERIPTPAFIINVHESKYDYKTMYANIEARETFACKCLPFVLNNDELHNIIDHLDTVKCWEKVYPCNIKNHVINSTECNECDKKNVFYMVKISINPFDTLNTLSLVILMLNVDEIYSQTKCYEKQSNYLLSIIKHMYPKEFILANDNEDTHLGFKNHSSVVIVFIDIVNFSLFCHSNNPFDVMKSLELLYTRFNEIVKDHLSLFKYDIAGDSYIVVGGISKRDNIGCMVVNSIVDDNVTIANHVQDALSFAEMAIQAAFDMNLTVRVGIHVGPAVSGVICSTTAPKFVICGDTINLACRVQSTCPPGHIQMSEDAFHTLSDDIKTSRGPWVFCKNVEVKGYGKINTVVKSTK